MRGDRKKYDGIENRVEDEQSENTTKIDIKNYRPRKVPSLMWRECIKKVWEVDPLECGKCGGLMKVISFIYKRSVIRKILDHLGLGEETVRNRAPPQLKQAIRELQLELFDDGWPQYDEPSVDVKIQ